MDVNVSATRDYYNSITDSALCKCGYCRNYRLQIMSALPEVAVYLDSLGIDIQKPFETSPLESDENGMLEYCCCQYIAFGNCDPNYQHRIGDVKFRMATYYPRTGIEEEHFVLEFYPIKLKFDKVQLINVNKKFKKY